MTVLSHGSQSPGGFAREGKPMTDELLIGHVATLFMAGFETTGETPASCRAAAVACMPV